MIQENKLLIKQIFEQEPNMTNCKKLVNIANSYNGPVGDDLDLFDGIEVQAYYNEFWEWFQKYIQPNNFRMVYDKERIVRKIIEKITPDLQENLFRMVMVMIEDDIDMNIPFENIVFTIHKNYKIDYETLKAWLNTSNANIIDFDNEA